MRVRAAVSQASLVRRLPCAKGWPLENVAEGWEVGAEPGDGDLHRAPAAAPATELLLSTRFSPLSRQ